MCLAVIALDRHSRYALIVAANRDEFHARPTERAHWWKDAHGASLLAGRDLEHGGTWLGITRCCAMLPTCPLRSNRSSPARRRSTASISSRATAAQQRSRRIECPASPC